MLNTFYHSLDVPPECTDGDIQLVGGADMSMGRVEVCSGGMWGTVCDDSFADIDAQVACRQLGYSGEGIRIAAATRPTDYLIHMFCRCHCTVLCCLWTRNWYHSVG